MRQELGRFRGREIHTTGDGFFATFDGPARAVRCALAIREAVRPLGLEIRTGLHTGECELRGDDVSGIAVHIGARVAAAANAGEVLVSGTLKDLVTGSGLRFVERVAAFVKQAAVHARMQRLDAAFEHFRKIRKARNVAHRNAFLA